MVGPPVAVVGEALVDVVHRADGTVRRVPGGSAANTAVALARLGVSTTLSTCLGPDDGGELVLGRLDAAGVDTITAPVPNTATALARVGADGAADYDLSIDWRPAGDLPEVPRHLHVGSLGVVLRPGSRTVSRLAAQAARAGVPVSYDVNLRPSLTGLGRRVVRAVTSMLQVADIVRLSEEDLDHMWPGDPVDESAATLLHAGAVAVVLTRGEAGASWFGRSGRVDVDAEPVEVVDTIGAGDTFTAGMLLGLERHGVLGAERQALDDLPADAWGEVLSLAARCAAVSVSREGADPPHLHELG